MPSALVEMWGTGMAPLRGRGTRGERLPGATPFGHWNTAIFMAALRHDGVDLPWVVDGPGNGDIFRPVVEWVLVSRPGTGDAVVMEMVTGNFDDAQVRCHGMPFGKSGWMAVVKAEAVARPRPLKWRPLRFWGWSRRCRPRHTPRSARWPPNPMPRKPGRLKAPDGIPQTSQIWSDAWIVVDDLGS